MALPQHLLSELLIANDHLLDPRAIRVYTYNGAFTAFEEDNRGSLEEGKFADMLVFSSGSLCDASEIPETWR